MTPGWPHGAIARVAATPTAQNAKDARAAFLRASVAIAIREVCQ